MIINMLFWYGVTEATFNHRDLNRLGSCATTKTLTEDIHYEQHHTEFAEYIAAGAAESFDVLTIGDSFTNGADGGSYPDYLVNHYGFKVLNVRLGRYDPLQILYILNESGWLDRISARVVLLESVERAVQYRYGHDIIRPLKIGVNELKRLLQRPTNSEELSQKFMPPIMYNANMNYVISKLHHLCNPEELSAETGITELDRKLFTNPGYENVMLYYKDDLMYLSDPINADMLSQNLNNAANLLKARGIKLVFFVGVDKYDLYYPYIIDKKGRPENPFFPKVRAVQGKDYVFVDTIKPLRDALEHGEKDIYFMNDTHWSHKGIKIVCDEIVKYILPESR